MLLIALIMVPLVMTSPFELFELFERFETCWTLEAALKFVYLILIGLKPFIKTELI